jgi:hypothetical protein
LLITLERRGGYIAQFSILVEEHNFEIQYYAMSGYWNFIYAGI